MKRLTLHEVHNDERSTFIAATGVVHRYNPGMLESCGSLRFTQEALNRIGRVEQSGDGHFHSDESLKFLVKCAIDFAESALAQLLLNQVAANSLTGNIFFTIEDLRGLGWCWIGRGLFGDAECMKHFVNGFARTGKSRVVVGSAQLF